MFEVSTSSHFAYQDTLQLLNTLHVVSATSANAFMPHTFIPCNIWSLSFLPAGEGRGRALAQGKRTGVEDGKSLAAHRPHGCSIQHQATVSHPFWNFNQLRPELKWWELSGTSLTEYVLQAQCMQTSANNLKCGSRTTVPRHRCKLCI